MENLRVQGKVASHAAVYHGDLWVRKRKVVAKSQSQKQTFLSQMVGISIVEDMGQPLDCRCGEGWGWLVERHRFLH